MEMEMEIAEEMGLSTLFSRLTAAAGVLEDAANRLAGREVDLEASFGRVATREAELEQKLVEANAAIASLKAARKTVAGGLTSLMAKDGVAVEAGALDAALGSLSLEQRIAVKSQLLRSGLIG
jgi:hypothetical protein